MRRGAGVLAIFAANALACGVRRATPPAPSRRSPPVAPAAIGTPSFRREILPLLVEHCATARGCHGDDPSESVDLDLRANAAYHQLVNCPAKARKGALRVTPGDPLASFLVDKMTGALGPQEGKAMPLDPDSGAPIEPSPVPSAFVERLTEGIRAGAPSN